MNFITTGTYHIRYMMNLRTRVSGFPKILCSNRTLSQKLKIENVLYQQVIWEGFVFFNTWDKLEFYLFDNGNNPLIMTSSVLFTRLISTKNVLTV